MSIPSRFKRAALALAVSGFSALAMAWTAAQAADTLRPDVAKPLNDAQNLYRAHHYEDALNKIAQAGAVPNKTPYETYMVEEMRGAAAMAAGQNGVAAQAYESLLASGQLKGEDAQRTTAALAGIYFQQKNYAQAIKAAQRYQKAGGGDPQMATLLVESYYLSGDYATATRLLNASVEAQVRGGHTPDEAQLQLLGTCAQRANDQEAYRGALEKLVAYHPKQSYWDDLLHAIRSKPGYLSALDLDTYRLRRATGSLSSADDYMEMTQLAIVAGSTAEGKQIIDQGFASGVLGHDAGADRERRLQALAAKRANAAPDPANPLAPYDAAFNQVYAGQEKQGLATMESLIAKGGLDHQDLARLRLGEAYFASGQKARAVQAFKAVKGNDGSAELAQLWVLVASKP
ncbi:tetratricopeptide repeat protein [Paraburkholderia silvatlantica]|uniref:Tetratricopeptide (TPR) repeat protein n=1 Tax=Paraburkholderia silvatlantica TaxID=321895 RepID=A0A2U1AFP2_9BURK|nr:tetratricopeptide repeat protein [Paraburkholderia silvatlantica]MBB2928646.1 tetratricopeptide (TPR) repeat protein [Paraburkholderia silvatlantica]PVY35232.1 tetratricopeptide repeat protein [Paraburkholderia silvatlantica]PXW40874.1 tetratricopeptide repeat protein [Paraburkholderia silvatlantica]PYE27342.1 tetratricopeptide repeat protein [Paraburkholderia silvatlantica]TDQ98299.1 tetratricopeptide repeat protein [Paraburkholderia silvatlantica]